MHPYLLLNYNGQYTDMSTLAHELGHAMHSCFAEQDAAVPLLQLSDLRRRGGVHVQRGAADRLRAEEDQGPKTRLALLGNYLENVKGTVFRQTQFAEFELRMHEMAEKGEPLTGDALAKLYLDITRKYDGHDARCLHGRRLHRARVGVHPAFLQPVLRLSVRDVVHGVDRAGREGAGRRCRQAVARYRAFLAAGGSKYPIDLLKDAGVDMTTTSRSI